MVIILVRFQARRKFRFYYLSFIYGVIMTTNERAKILYSYLLNSQETYGRHFCVLQDGAHFDKELTVIAGKTNVQTHKFLVLTEGEAMQRIENYLSFHIDSIHYDVLSQYSQAMQVIGKEGLMTIRSLAGAKRAGEFNNILQNLMMIGGRWNEFLEVVGQQNQWLLATADGQERRHIYEDTEYYIFKII